MKKMLKRTLILFVLLSGLCVKAFAMPDSLIPVGRLVGIHLSGEMVVAGFDEEFGAGAQAAGIRPGDRIVSVNGIPADDLEDLHAAVDERSNVVLTVERKGKLAEFCLSPVETGEGKRVGLKIRDGITGVGTVTFYDPATGNYGALGHSINDPETGKAVSMSDGEIMEASVTNVIKGRPGAPGELHGAFGREEVLGSIRCNSPAGIFGQMEMPLTEARPLPLASGEQVECAGAQMLANVSGTKVCPYQVEIEGVNPDDAGGRNLLLRITDEQLLETTGGVVPGMSGSPLIQNGRLIGAVTHVFVDDPTRGYGILIENMLDAQ